MNVLLSAFACDSKMGSEPYVGWNWLKIISRMSTRVVLLTRKHHEQSLIESTKDFPNVSIVAFDLYGCSALDHRAKSMKMYYVVWQFWALFYAISLAKKTKFDFVMHSTYNVVDFPGFLWLLKDTPFAWGPVGGGQVPPRWSKPLYERKWLKQRVRAFMKSFVKFNPFVFAALKKSFLILVANKDTLDLLPLAFAKKYHLMLETAINDLPFAPEKKSISAGLDHVFSMLWVGQLEHRKALPILLDALIKVRQLRPDIFSNTVLTVVGSGPEKEKLRNYITEHQLSDRVNLVGKVNFDQMTSFYGDADLFAFTSVQDTSGNVVLEALSYAIPVLAINHQGVKEILDNDCAFLISPLSYLEAVNGFAEKIIFVYDNPSWGLSVGKLGLQRLQEKHTWNSREKDFRRLANEFFNPSENIFVR